MAFQSVGPLLGAVKCIVPGCPNIADNREVADGFCADHKEKKRIMLDKSRMHIECLCGHTPE